VPRTRREGRGEDQVNDTEADGRFASGVGRHVIGAVRCVLDLGPKPYNRVVLGVREPEAAIRGQSDPYEVSQIR
jgi:hypothetical protein